MVMVMADRAFWTDHLGKRRPVVKHRGNPRLKFSVALHAALRSFVLHRDGFRCRHCGLGLRASPAAYDGRYCLLTDPGVCLVVDHIISIRRGGTHHPDNLQTLCDPCNAAKACRVEGAGGPCHA